MSYYVGQNVALDLTCIVDGKKMTAADSAEVLVLKPNKTSQVWVATLDLVKGTVNSLGVVDMAGKWKFQPMVTFPISGEIPGTPVVINVEKLITG
jgi:NAD-dependent oxidoreductase involved in siderophore biosynthesis